MSALPLLRRPLLALLLTGLLCALAFGTGHLLRTQADAADAADAAGPASRPSPAAPAERPAAPTRPRRTAEPAPAPVVEPEAPAAPVLRPGPRLLGPGDESDDVRELQARLAQIDWFDAGVTGYYGEVTEEAVRGFQAKRGIPVTGEVDRRTQDRLLAMTTQPTEAELSGLPAAGGGNTPGPLDSRCTTGRVLCVDKTSDTLRWVVDGEVLTTVDVRFGGAATPTREGEFSVYRKSRDHVSSLYDTSMPFAMFFSGGQAVHYSPDFAAVGYAGASHGCVNVRDYDAVAALYDQVALGDRVVVYRS